MINSVAKMRELRGCLPLLLGVLVYSFVVWTDDSDIKPLHNIGHWVGIAIGVFLGIGVLIAVVRMIPGVLTILARLLLTIARHILGTETDID